MTLLAAEASGVITGGWEYVWASYVLTAVTFTLYTVSLLIRTPRNSND